MGLFPGFQSQERETGGCIGDIVLVVLARRAGIPASALALLRLEPVASPGQSGILTRDTGFYEDVDGKGGCKGIGFRGLLLSVGALPVLVAQFRKNLSPVFLLSSKEILLPSAYRLPVIQVITMS